MRRIWLAVAFVVLAIPAWAQVTNPGTPVFSHGGADLYTRTVSGGTTTLTAIATGGASLPTNTISDGNTVTQQFSTNAWTLVFSTNLTVSTSGSTITVTASTNLLTQAQGTAISNGAVATAETFTTNQGYLAASSGVITGIQMDDLSQWFRILMNAAQSYLNTGVAIVDVFSDSAGINAAASTNYFWYAGHIGPSSAATNDILTGEQVHLLMNDSNSNTSVANAVAGTNGYNGVSAVHNTSAMSVPGKINSALSLNGSSDYITLTNAAGTVQVYTQITICAWIDPSAISGTINSVFSIGTGTTIYFDFWCGGTYYSQGMGVYFGGSPAASSAANTFTSGDLNQWCHAALVYDSTQTSGNCCKFYKNGALLSKQSDNLTGLTTAGTSMMIGQNHANLYYFPGRLDDLRIYNRALSATAIQQIYNSGSGTEQDVAGTSSTNAPMIIQSVPFYVVNPPSQGWLELSDVETPNAPTVPGSNLFLYASADTGSTWTAVAVTNQTTRNANGANVYGNYFTFTSNVSTALEIRATTTNNAGPTFTDWGLVPH